MVSIRFGIVSWELYRKKEEMETFPGTGSDYIPAPEYKGINILA
jgi:hypothetical protein